MGSIDRWSLSAVFHAQLLLVVIATHLRRCSRGSGHSLAAWRKNFVRGRD